MKHNSLFSTFVPLLALLAIWPALGMVVLVIVICIVFLFCVIVVGLWTRQAKALTGIEHLLEQTGETMSQLDPKGQLLINGEVWAAQSIKGKISKGEQVKVIRIKGITLYVEPLGHA